MLRSRLPIVLLAAALALAGSGASVAATGVAVVRVDLKAKQQVMQGFGSTVRVWSDPHLSKYPQTVVPPAAQAQILTAIYRRLGLTRSRQFLDAGIAPGPGGPYKFSGKLGPDQVAYVKQAESYGLRTFFPAPVYLEDWMKADDPAGYVAYAMTILRYWRSQGLTVPFYSPINEPQVSHDFPPQWLHDVVVMLGRQLRAERFKTKLVIPDDENPIDAYRRADAVLSDPAARQYVGAIAYHIYRIGGPADRLRMKALAARYRLPLWMTEYWSSSYGSWTGALSWAQTVHELIADDGVSAVDYLWAFFGDWVGPGGTLISIAFDNGVYKSFSYTPLYWATGQFSRFVRPGYVRVAATPADGSALVSAYTGAKRLVVVAINPHAEATTVRVAVRGGRLGPRVSAVRSSATERWAALATSRATRTAFSATLAPGSITTYVAPLTR